MPEDYKAQIQVVVDPDAKTISLTDTGLGMTADEVDEYINQVAFSGATDFLEKYKDKTNEEQIIGHFGLGFYSAFMVSDKVTIDTLSWQKDATPVRWESEGGINFEMSDGTKDTVGTTITLYLSEDSLEFANEYRVREILDKYCSFMPVEIFLSKANAEQEYETIDAADVREDDVVVEHIHEDAKTEEKENEKSKKEIEKLKEKINKAKEQNEKILKYQTYTEEDKKLKEKSKEIREKETKIQISQKALQKILPKQEMLSEKLKELKSNTDKKQNIEKDIKEGEKIEEKNKIKLLKINELKEILDTYKKAKEKSIKTNIKIKKQKYK